MAIKILREKGKLFSHLFVLFVCFYISGCAALKSGGALNDSQLPKWILNPSANGVIGGVGYCAAHVNGVTGQRELAAQRALEEIARQKGVSVDSVMVVSSSASSYLKNRDTDINTISTFKSNNKVTAYIKEIWVHPVTKEMYVYMVAE